MAESGFTHSKTPERGASSTASGPSSRRVAPESVPDEDRTAVIAKDAARSAEQTAVIAREAKYGAASAEGVGRRAGTRTGKVGRVGATLRPTRKARLRIARVDPWSVMKTALLFSIAAAIITIVAVGLLWSVVEASGVIQKLQEALNALLGNADGSGTIQIRSYVDAKRVLGLTAIVSVINVVLITAIATLAAFLYNLAATLLGGLEITLSED